METKHTQGTWHSHDGQIYPEQTGKTICLIPYYDKDNEEQQANAKLIAAAPNLLQALEISRLCLLNPAKPITENEMDEINEAINQATI
jgi:hypothetical protein